MMRFESFEKELANLLGLIVMFEQKVMKSMDSDRKGKEILSGELRFPYQIGVSGTRFVPERLLQPKRYSASFVSIRRE